MVKKKKPEKVTPQFKSFAFDAKAVAEEPDEDGMVYVPAYGSVFDVLDSHEDVTVKGTFDRTLKEWAEKGAPIPAHFNHAMFSTDPMDNVGYMKEAAEDDHGLKLLVGLDVAHNTKAAYLHRLIKQKRLRELSIGYMPKSWEYVKKDGAQHDWDTYRKLTDVDLLEVSFVPVGSNRQATVLEKTTALLYGKTDDDEAESGDDEVDVSAALVAAAAALTAAAEALTAEEPGDDSVEGEEKTSEAGDDPADDDSGQEVESKGLSARARVALAMMAVQTAGTE